MKKVVSLGSALILLLMLCAPAFAAGLTRARPVVDLSGYEGMPGFEYDASTGDWKLRSNEAQALLRAVNAGNLRAGGTRTAAFYLQLEGNAQTGAVLPVLYVDYAGRNMNATAVSVRVGDTRYDLSVHSQPVEEGGGIERMRALLDPEGMEMLEKIRSAEEITLRLHGDDSYTTVMRVRKSFTSSKERLEGLSLSCVDLSDVLRAMRFDEYKMHAENAEDWYVKTGVRPQLQTVDLKNESVPKGTSVPELDKEMRMISSGENNRNVKLLEDKLIAMHYLAGTANNAYGIDTKRAVEDIQRAYALVPTGSADGQLLNILFGQAPVRKEAAADETAAVNRVNAAGDVRAEAGVTYAVEDALELTLNRYWFAGTVQTNKPVGAMSGYSATNRDNVLLIVEGRAKNLSAGEMSFNRSVQAKAVLGGKYAYDAAVKCESDAGERFDTYLLPLGQSRVVLCAEVPAAALEEDGEWTFIVEMGNAKLTYTLE